MVSIFNFGQGAVAQNYANSQMCDMMIYCGLSRYGQVVMDPEHGSLNCFGLIIISAQLTSESCCGKEKKLEKHYICLIWFLDKKCNIDPRK